MMSWHEMNESGAERYRQRLAEADHARLFRRTQAGNNRFEATPLRSRLARLLHAVAYWLDSQTAPSPRYDAERREVFR